MSAPICTNASLATTCYQLTSITEKQQKALIVYAKMLQLAIIGGTDYVGRLNLLLSDSAALCCGMTEKDRDAARVHLQFAKAAVAGASVPDTISAKQAQINCLVESDEKQLDEADLLLTCRLGIHKSYPQ